MKNHYLVILALIGIGSVSAAQSLPQPCEVIYESGASETQAMPAAGSSFSSVTCPARAFAVVMYTLNEKGALQKAAITHHCYGAEAEANQILQHARDIGVCSIH
jgi:hypothetical protein